MKMIFIKMIVNTFRFVLFVLLVYFFLKYYSIILIGNQELLISIAKFSILFIAYIVILGLLKIYEIISKKPLNKYLNKVFFPWTAIKYIFNFEWLFKDEKPFNIIFNSSLILFNILMILIYTHQNEISEKLLSIQKTQTTNNDNYNSQLIDIAKAQKEISNAQLKISNATLEPKLVVKSIVEDEGGSEKIIITNLNEKSVHIKATPFCVSTVKIRDKNSNVIHEDSRLLTDYYPMYKEIDAGGSNEINEPIYNYGSFHGYYHTARNNLDTALSSDKLTVELSLSRFLILEYENIQGDKKLDILRYPCEGNEGEFTSCKNNGTSWVQKDNPIIFNGLAYNDPNLGGERKISLSDLLNPKNVREYINQVKPIQTENQKQEPPSEIKE